MPIANNAMSEVMQVLANLPTVSTTTARTSTPVLLNKHARALLMVSVGDCSASSTVTLLKCGDTNAASSSAIASASLGDTGTVGDNTMLLFNITPDDAFDSVRPYFAVTIGAGAALAGAVILGGAPKYSTGAQLAGVTVVR